MTLGDRGSDNCSTLCGLDTKSIGPRALGQMARIVEQSPAV